MTAYVLWVQWIWSGRRGKANDSKAHAPSSRYASQETDAQVYVHWLEAKAQRASLLEPAFGEAA